MGYFPATIAAHLAGEVVRMARLVELSFAGQTGRYWEGGFGDLRTADGKIWKGTGALVDMSEIEGVQGGTAPEVTLTLSGVDPTLVPEVLAAETKVKGRNATVFLQFFADDWSPLDLPYAIFLGQMDVMSIKASAETASISLTLEGLFTRRGIPPWAYLSNESQQRLFPGDLGLAEMASMRLAQPHWPLYG